MVPAIYSQCFLWAFLSWTNGQQSKKGPIWHVKNYLWHTRPKCQKKEKWLMETIHYFDVSHTTFLPNFFQSSTPMWEILKFSVANKTGYIPNIYSKNRKHWKTMWLFNWQYLLQNFDECMYIHIILISHYSLIPPLFYLCKDLLHYHWLLCNYRTYFYI